jgi:fibronectin type 3 domain-containing protein
MMRLSAAAASAAILFSFSVLSNPARAQAVAQVEATRLFPEIDLARRLHGTEAVTALGDRVGSIAASYGMTAAELISLLQSDATLWIDETGHLLYIDDPAPADSPAPAASEPAEAPLDQTFLLHSKPGSQRVLYLDFDGHTTVNSAWSNGSGTINAKAYDKDGDPTTFSDVERTEIQIAWSRLAEDYAPFDVDVTTEDPGTAAIDRTSSSDQVYGTRCVITTNDFGACNGTGTCGGVAYVGVFDWPYGNHAYYQPAWAFVDGVGTGAKNLAEVCSHEVGHNLGLSHDGTTTGNTYYTGHGSGASGWAPIMGAGYYKEVTQWSKGEYPNANQTQDDLAIINTHGAVYRPDGGSTLSGTPGVSTFTIDHWDLVQQSGEQDDFTFQTSGGPAHFYVDPLNYLGYANVDLSASLYQNGALVETNNDPTNLGAALTLTLAAGTYVLRVEGVGDTDPAPGYTNYGSIGQYHVTGDFPQAAVPLAPTDLVAGAGSQKVYLNWTASADATSYNVYKGTSAGGESANPVKTGVTETSTIMTGLVNGTPYYFKIKAVNASGTSAFSNEASTTPVGPPAAPTNLSATSGDTQITLNWTASANATQYFVYQGTSSGGESGTPVATVTGTTATVTGLSNGVTYFFRLKANNVSGSSAYSSEVSAGPVGPPSAPTLTGTPGNNKAYLSWPASPGATSYAVYKGTSADGEGANPVKSIVETSTIMTGLTNGSTYYFKVKAVNAQGASGYSNEAAVTPVPPPDAPTSVTATTVNSGSITLNWAAGANALTYNIYRGASAGGESATPIKTGVTGATFTAKGLAPNTTYYFRLKSVNGSGSSVYSNEASATTNP